MTVNPLPPPGNVPDRNESFEIADANRVRRHHERGHYDRATVFGILDRGLVAHVAFVHDGRPVVIPMSYGRDGDRLFLHGARKGRITTVAAGAPVSIGVTLVDGIVVAQSLFDSSMNYRAVVIHGDAFELTDDAERLQALRCVVEHNMPGRWAEVRPPNAQELKATTLLEVQIESASAKIREGGPVGALEEGADDVWCGVVPVMSAFSDPIPDHRIPASVGPPPSVDRFRNRQL